MKMQLSGARKRDTITPVKTYTGRVIGLELDAQGRQAAWVDCPASAVPAAGQVVMASAPADEAAEASNVLATPLYLGGVAEHGFLALPLEARLPLEWLPGVALQLRGPLGRGFRLPGNLRRLALAALGETAGRLLPLAQRGLALGADVALFAGQIPAVLPASVEFQPLNALPEALAWADFLALDLPREQLPGLRIELRLEHARRLPCAAQALVSTAMPCAGLAACGACALPAPRGWKLACEDGPVFDLDELDW